MDPSQADTRRPQVARPVKMTRPTSSYSSNGSAYSSMDDDPDSPNPFDWSSSASASSYTASSPASSAFSAFTSNSSSTCYSPVASSSSRSFIGRRRASTSVSATLEAFAKLNTLEEHDAEEHSVSPPHVSNDELLPDAELEVNGLFQEPRGEEEQQERPPFSSLLSLVPRTSELGPAPSFSGNHTSWQDVTDSSAPPLLLPPFEPVRPSAPPVSTEVHETAEAEAQPDSGDPVDGQVAGEARVPPDASGNESRLSLKTKLSQRLLSKGRARASSLSRLPFVRPKLERREATHASTSTSTSPSTPSDESPYSSDADLAFQNGFPQARSRAFRRLQGRFTRTAPSTPVLTPSPSTDRVHLFRSRPSSIVVSSRGVEFNYFTPIQRNQPVHPSEPQQVQSQVSSCNVSLYQQALDSPVPLDASVTTHGSFVDALPSPQAQLPQPVNLFDTLLPREVRVKIFGFVVRVAQEELANHVASGKWTASRAARERWIGQRGGLRELVKMSRVCREWREMAFDGQLWQDVAISNTLGVDCFRPSGIVMLANHAGSFLRRLDLRGFSNLRSEDLEGITEACAGSLGVTRLQHIDLSGCNLISTRSLHHLLSHSPDLKHLNLRGLQSVVPSTCYMIIANSVDRLEHLDVSLCRRLPAASLLGLDQPELRHLGAARLANMHSDTVSDIPSQFPQLRYLDIGYSRQLTDDAFKSWPSAEDGAMQLEGLRLSGCVRLTDQTCVNLVGKIPQLQCLELANIGGNMRDNGLIKLIETCPNLTNLDLEDAAHLTDRVIVALTPPKHQQLRGPPSPLEHLNVTNIPDLSEACLIRLIRACPKLRILECANSSTVSDLLVKAFAHHVKKFGIRGSELSIVDCRNVGRQAFRDHINVSRPRRGVREYSSRHFGYLEPDGRARGLAECDESRIVMHSFWAWQQLDEAESAVRALRTAQLAKEAGSNAGGNHPYPLTLRVRRASFGMRGGNDGSERSGGGCIVS